MKTAAGITKKEGWLTLSVTSPFDMACKFRGICTSMGVSPSQVLMSFIKAVACGDIKLRQHPESRGITPAFQLRHAENLGDFKFYQISLINDAGEVLNPTSLTNLDF